MVGLLGKPTMLNIPSIEATCKEKSTKEVKSRSTDTVKFDFKEKGKKPVVTKGVCQFSITGQDFNVAKIAEVLKSAGVSELN